MSGVIQSPGANQLKTGDACNISQGPLGLTVTAYIA